MIIASVTTETRSSLCVCVCVCVCVCEREREREIERERERERYVLFNDALNTFYLRFNGVRHMVKDHSDSEKGNPPAAT